MENQKKKMQLPKVSVDDLFTSQYDRDIASKEHIENIDISQIVEFKNHPFKVLMNDDMVQMVESVKEHGVLVPTIVRKLDNGKYEMISGHRRMKASELADLTTIPCIIKDFTDDEATIVMVDSNLQREHILPSEKAFAYKMKLEAISHQGKVTSRQLGEKLLSVDLLGNELGDSGRQVQRYIRLTNLIPEILEFVDSGRIALSPAVEISFLKEDEQYMLLDCMDYNVCTPSHAQSIKLKNLSRENIFTEENMNKIMEEEKPNQVEKFKINKDRLRNILPKNMSEAQTEDYIVKAVEFYNNHQRKKDLSR